MLVSDHGSRLYTATELAADLGTTARALRFYESKGLLRPRRAGNRRVYDQRDRGRLSLILRGKRLGFSLAEIGDYLDLYDADPSHTEQLRHLHRAVSERIASLEEQRAALELTLGELEEIRSQAGEALEARIGRRPGATGIAAAAVDPTDTCAADGGATDRGATDMGATDMGATDMGATDMGATDMGATNRGAPDIGE